jgi:hypothetical protein
MVTTGKQATPVANTTPAVIRPGPGDLPEKAVAKAVGEFRAMSNAE